MNHLQNSRMKRLYFFITLVLSFFKVVGQTQSMQVDTINCIVVNRFHIMNNEYYCPSESFLYYEGDTIRFFPISSWNYEISKRYPDLKNMDVFNDVKGVSDSQKVSDLYDYHTNLFFCKLCKYGRDENGKNIVTSPAFYFGLNDNSIYSVYRFTGIVCFYQGINIPDNINQDCPCQYSKTNVDKIAVLKKTFSVKRLNRNDLKKLHFTKSNMLRIRILTCE